MTERVLIVDIPRGGLAGLARSLESAGVEAVRINGDLAELEELKGESFLGAVVHYKRKEMVAQIRQVLKARPVPSVLWFPANVDPDEYKDWILTGALDMAIGKMDTKELIARLQGFSRSLRNKLPWLQEAVRGLMRIGQAVTSREDDFTVLSTTAREMEKLFPGVRCTIMMITPEQEDAMAITQGDYSEQLNISIQIEKYPEIQKMLSTRKPVAIKDVQKHPMMKEVRELLKAKDLQSILAVPIFYRDEVIGLIMLRSSGKQRSFGRVEIGFLEMVSQSTAVALRNIRLGREVAQEMARTKEALKVVRKKSSDLARMEALFDHASDGIVVVDKKGKIKGVNVNFTRLSGYVKEDVEGKSIDEIIFPAEGDGFSVSRALKRAKDDERLTRRISQVLHGKDKQRRHVAVRIEHLPRRKEWLVSMHDVTEERELGEALRRTKEFLENVIESSMDAIIAADMNGTIILFNQAAEQITRHKADDVIGKMNIVDLYAPGVARSIMKKLRSDDYGGKGKLESSYNVLIGKTGEDIPINMSASIIYEDGREAATVGIFVDLRERIEIEKELRSAQESLIKAQQKETLMALSGAASHELNQPLTSILGYAEMLRRVEKNLAKQFPDHPGITSLKNAAEVISQEAERMAEVVRKIGEVSEFKTTEYVGGAKIMDLDKARGEVQDQRLVAWQAMFQHMKEAVIVIGDDTLIRMANPAAVVLAAENPVGKSFTRYFRGIDYKRATELFSQVKEGESIEFEIDGFTADERKVTLKVQGLWLPETKEILAVYSDVSGERRREREIKTLNAFQEQLVKNTTLPLVAMDVDGKVTFWNQAAEKLFGYEADEIRGKVPDFLLEGTEPENFQEHFRQLRREGEMAEEVVVQKRSGETFRAYHVDSVMRDDEGNALGYISMIFDFSGLQAFKKELNEKTAQLAVMNDIAGAVRSGVGLEETIGGILKNLSRIVPLDLCAVTLADPQSSDVLVLSYVPSMDLVDESTIRVYPDDTETWKIIFPDQPSIYDDPALFHGELVSEDLREALKEAEFQKFRSIVNYPLVSRGETLGTLHVLSREEGKYNINDLDRLAQVSGPITMGLANARMFNQIQRQNLELSSRTAWMEELIKTGQSIHMGMRSEDVINRLVEPYFAAHARQHLTAWLRDREDGRDEFRLAAAVNYDNVDKGMKLEISDGLRDRIGESRESIEIFFDREENAYKPLLQGSRSAFIVPLVALDTWLGLVVIESHHRGAFVEDEKVEVKILASQIAGFLRNLRFYSELDLALRFQRGLIEDANAIILVLDSEGRIVLINRALQELVGVPVGKYLGEHFREFFERHLKIELPEEHTTISPGDNRFSRIVRNIEKGESLANLRVTITGEEGREAKTVFNTSSILDREGAFQGFIAIGQNMTRYQELEQHLLESEKLATVGRLAAGIAHDLNNPITGLINTIAMLSRQENLDSRARNLLVQLKDETRRIETLAQNLMSYAKPSAEEMFPLDLQQVILDSLSFSNYELSRGRVVLEARIPDGLPLIRGIKSQLQQVFINILTNASHACADKGGGKVVIDARLKDESTVEVEISDSGAGIDPAHMDRLFDPFFTTKPEGKGTGLGLLIVKEIVTRHDGSVSVHSEQGKGTTFIVTLPVYVK